VGRSDVEEKILNLKQNHRHNKNIKPGETLRNTIAYKIKDSIRSTRLPEERIRDKERSSMEKEATAKKSLVHCHPGVLHAVPVIIGRARDNPPVS
jgi:hypothetical protein